MPSPFAGLLNDMSAIAVCVDIAVVHGRASVAAGQVPQACCLEQHQFGVLLKFMV